MVDRRTTNLTIDNIPACDVGRVLDALFMAGANVEINVSWPEPEQPETEDVWKLTTSGEPERVSDIKERERP